MVAFSIKTIGLSLIGYLRPHGGQRGYQGFLSKIKPILSISLYNNPLNRVSSVLLSLGAIIILKSLSLLLINLPPVPIFHLIVVYAAFSRGVVSGLQSAAVGWLYVSLYYSTSGRLFTYTQESFVYVFIASITMPVLAFMVGTLQYRANLRVAEEINLIKQKAKNRALKQQERQYRLIFERNIQPMWITDLYTLKILAVNDAAIKHYGYTRNEFLSMTVKDLYSPEDLPRLLKSIKRSHLFSNYKVEVTGEWRHKKRDGSFIDVEVARSAVVFQGRRAKLVEIHDITSRKRLQKLKDEFLATATHELKTPVTTLKLFTETHLNKYWQKGSDVIKVEDLRLIDQELDRLTGLINDLADVSRIGAGKMKLTLELVRLNSLIGAVVKLMQKMEGNHRLDFSEGPPLEVIADNDRLRQVLINLISNAFKYSPEGGLVTVSVKQKGDNAVIAVGDEGVGIPPEKRRRIFDKYYQIDELSQRGFGLGLYISREIVVKHKGKIWVESVVGKGSTFYVSLPLLDKTQK